MVIDFVCVLFSFNGTHLIAEAEKCVNGHQAKVISGLLSHGLVSHREEKWALESNAPGLRSSSAFYWLRPKTSHLTSGTSVSSFV